MYSLFLISFIYFIYSFKSQPKSNVIPKYRLKYYKNKWRELMKSRKIYKIKVNDNI